MSRFSALKRRLLASTGGGGVTLNYDNRFGTATDANGWFTFALHSGNRRVWVDSSRPDDSGDGLSAATAKKTFEAAKTVFLSGFTAGDQLMIAGGSGGGTYTDAGSFPDFSASGGISLAYPTAVLSYDRADPSNTAKYGRLVGSQMPSLQITAGGCAFQMQADNSQHYFAVQGIELDAQGSHDAQLRFIGRHDGICFQNVRLKEIRLNIDNAGSSFGLSQTLNVSKFTTWGAWTNDNTTAQGNFSCFYLADLNGFWAQDGVMVHGGWRIGANRDDTPTSGGTTVFGHNLYYHASNINGRFDRITSFDGADNGFGIRGAAGSSCLVSFDDPAPLVMGAYSTTQAEAPSGVVVTADDVLIAGSSLINSSWPTMPDAINTTSAIAGSYVRTAAIIDNAADRAILGQDHTKASVDLAFTTSFLLDNVRSHNASNILEHINYGPTQNPAVAVVTWTNSFADNLTYYEASTNTTSTVGSGVAVWSPSPAGYQTKDQLFTTALTNAGLTPAGTAAARKNQLVNAMLWRNDLAGQFAAALQWIGLPSLGQTPTKTPSTSFPNVSADTPRTVY